MRFSSALSLALLQAADLVSAVPSGTNSAPRAVTSKASKRPNHPAAPYHPGKSFPASPARSKTCTVRSHDDGRDDSEYIMNAIRDCNNGGHVLFAAAKKYIIGTALDLTFLKHIDIGTSVVKLATLLPLPSLD